MAIVKAIYKNHIIAESERTVVVEGNHYFPKEDVNFSFLIESETSTNCPWKGDANYCSIKLGQETLQDACWYYPRPSLKAKKIKNHYAFWGEVKVVTEI